MRETIDRLHREYPDPNPEIQVELTSAQENAARAWLTPSNSRRPPKEMWTTATEASGGQGSIFARASSGLTHLGSELYALSDTLRPTERGRSQPQRPASAEEDDSWEEARPVTGGNGKPSPARSPSPEVSTTGLFENVPPPQDDRLGLLGNLARTRDFELAGVPRKSRARPGASSSSGGFFGHGDPEPSAAVSVLGHAQAE